MQPAYFCSEYPIIKYIINMKSVTNTDRNFTLQIVTNKTESDSEVILTNSDRLEENQFYQYSITAVNSLGRNTSVTKYLCELVNINKY